MPDLVSRFKYELRSVPGAVVTFRRPTAASRSAFLTSQAATLAKVREIQRERKPLDEAYQQELKALKAELLPKVDAAVEAGETRKDAEARIAEAEILGIYFRYRAEHPEWSDLIDRQNVIEHDGIGWARLRQMVVAVDGLADEDGPIVGAEDIITRCPPEITDELIAEAERISGLGATERGELPLPGISPLPVDGQDPSTTAPAVDPSPVPA